MARRPENKPSDYRYQEEIDKSWDPKLKKGDLFWVFNKKTGKVWGPYNFSHYTYLGAVGWGKANTTFSVKVRYSRGEIVCGSEKVATERQILHKAFQYARLSVEAEELKKEIDQLVGKLEEMKSET